MDAWTCCSLTNDRSSNLVVSSVVFLLKRIYNISPFCHKKKNILGYIVFTIYPPFVTKKKNILGFIVFTIYPPFVTKTPIGDSSYLQYNPFLSQKPLGVHCVRNIFSFCHKRKPSRGSSAHLFYESTYLESTNKKNLKE